MRRATLTDTITGKTWNLAALIERDGEIPIGRIGSGLVIELGQSIDADIKERNTGKRLTKEDIERLRQLVETLPTVSKQHATIDYRYGKADHGWGGQNYYIKDHSTNGTRIGEDTEPFKWNDAVLKGRCELYFGNYGPVVFEEQH